MPACRSKPCKNSSVRTLGVMTGRATGSNTSSATCMPGRTRSRSLTRPATSRRGRRSPDVQRQWCGAAGKKENCIVTVHLAYARDGFHALLDGELYLPKSWSGDREAGIPDDMVYRPKWKIALELDDRATGNGLHFDWSTFDEGEKKLGETKGGAAQSDSLRCAPFSCSSPILFGTKPAQIFRFVVSRSPAYQELSFASRQAGMCSASFVPNSIGSSPFSCFPRP